MSKDEFRARVAVVNAGMPDVQGANRPVPLLHHADSDRLCFLTGIGTDAVAIGAVPCAHVIAENGEGSYAHLSGALSLSGDTAKPDDLCSPVAADWFEADRDDPDIRLLSFKITKGAVRATPAWGGASISNVARAQFAEGKPGMGERFTI